ncbi:MAG: transcriptional regulator [Gammaproteobacteria bacterium]|nr:MAG: transcriptional regulator [Gammaproteobacteria bacterium]
MLISKNEIITKISQGEDSTIEFKEKITNKDSMADEITAFANGKGGIILIGINDNGDVIGIPLKKIKKIEKTIIEICNDSIKPAINIFTEKLTINDKNILKINVPYSLFVHKSSRGYFIRQGSSKREMMPDQLSRLMQSRSQARIIRFDEQAVPNTDIKTLQKDLYSRFISNPDMDKKAKLHKRNLLSKDGNATVAGVLMCTNKSCEYLYNSFIQAVYYTSNVKDANYQIDAKDFKSSLDNQIIDAYKFVEKYNKISATKNIGRLEKPQYNMRAVFEAIVNAVVHRDYSKHGSKIRLFLFDDRLEIISPGLLPNTITVDTLADNQVTRNELLTRLLSEIQLDENVKVGRVYFLERRGEGVGIILRESLQLSDKKPIYEMIGEELKLTIFAAESLQNKNN